MRESSDEAEEREKGRCEGRAVARERTRQLASLTKTYSLAQTVHKRFCLNELKKKKKSLNLHSLFTKIKLTAENKLQTLCIQSLGKIPWCLQKTFSINKMCSNLIVYTMYILLPCNIPSYFLRGKIVIQYNRLLSMYSVCKFHQIANITNQTTLQC